MTGAPVRISEDQYLKILRQLLNRSAKIVDLFSRILRRAGDDEVRLAPRLGHNAFHDTGGGVGFGRENEKNFVVLVIELAKSGEVAFESRLDSLARTKNRSEERRVGKECR